MLCYVSRYHELAAKVDEFFARVESRHGNDMQCATGCSDCCHVRLSVTQSEAAQIRELLAAMPAAQRAALGTGPSDRCAALSPEGRCQIYAARPFVCRTHGAPIRMTQQSLPVIQSCFRNFVTVTPDPDCVLDQTTLSALTLTVDRADGGDGSRIDLAELIASC